MALFQRKPKTESSSLLYSIGLNKTLLIVGLGNPGQKYQGTRHNIGFACIEAFAAQDDISGWTLKKDLKCQLASGRVGDSRVILIKPETFMNLSGQAVAVVAQFYKLPYQNILVIHDELDIPFGQIRTRRAGSSAGHKGVASIIEHCGDEFGRVRVGIKADSPMEGSDFVLAKFNEDEVLQLPNLTREVLAISSEYVYSGGQLPTETRNFIV